MRARSLSILVAFVIASSSSTLATLAARARADEAAIKSACLAAADTGQDRRNDGQLRAAREQFLVCAASSCPGVVRKECEKWLSEVDDSLPSIVISATRDGGDVFSVKVSLDGAPLVDKLDGKAIVVDPGVHTFRFETEGSSPVERKVLIKEGERNRAVAVSFDEPKATPKVVEPASTTSTMGSAGDVGSTGKSSVRALPWVIGGVGVIALGSFAFFGLGGAKQISDLKSSCAPNCNPSDLDAAKRKLVIADVSLGVGIVALGVATYLFITAPPSSSSSSSSSSPSPSGTAARVQLDVRSVAGGGLAELRAVF